jgi:hypothetical protein
MPIGRDTNRAVLRTATGAEADLVLITDHSERCARDWEWLVSSTLRSPASDLTGDGALHQSRLEGGDERTEAPSAVGTSA